MAVTKTTADFVARAQVVHGDRYDYTDSVYTGALNQVNIRCKLHGVFSQMASDHINAKRNCPVCGLDSKRTKSAKTRDQFIAEAMAVHGNKYDYTKVKYVNARADVIIRCAQHGDFFQPPMRHIDRSAGCRKCTSTISKAETIWLNELDIPLEFRQTTIDIDGKLYRVDAFDPTTNTVYEFWGDYWHGNPVKYKSTEVHPVVGKTYGELYNLTLEKRRCILEAGFKLVERWETE